MCSPAWAVSSSQHARVVVVVAVVVMVVCTVHARSVQTVLARGSSDQDRTLSRFRLLHGAEKLVCFTDRSSTTLSFCEDVAFQEAVNIQQMAPQVSGQSCSSECLQ